MSVRTRRIEKEQQEHRDQMLLELAKRKDGVSREKLRAHYREDAPRRALRQALGSRAARRRSTKMHSLRPKKKMRMPVRAEAPRIKLNRLIDAQVNLKHFGCSSRALERQHLREAAEAAKKMDASMGMLAEAVDAANEKIREAMEVPKHLL